MSRRPAQPVRLFVAVYPPTKVSAEMIGDLGALSLPPHRITPSLQVHLTLQFIGDTELDRLDEVIESVRRSASGLAPFELRPRRLIALPEQGPKRLVAMETDAPATMLELQRRLAQRLARSPRGDPGDRFLPHLTLCRFRAPTPFAQPGRDSRIAPFTVDRVMLMRSVLLPGGAEHREVARAPLDGAGPPTPSTSDDPGTANG